MDASLNLDGGIHFVCSKLSDNDDSNKSSEKYGTFMRINWYN